MSGTRYIHCCHHRRRSRRSFRFWEDSLRLYLLGVIVAEANNLEVGKLTTLRERKKVEYLDVPLVKLES